MESGQHIRPSSKVLWQELRQEMADGMAGLNVGIPMGLEKLSYHICNIQKGRYDVLGGATGTGKTAVVDSGYLYNPINFLEKNPDYQDRLNILYFSIEITPKKKLAKLITHKLYDDHGILLDSKHLFSRGSVGLLEPAIDKKVNEYQHYFESILDNYVEFYASASPNFVYKVVMDHAERNGVMVRDPKTNAIVSYTPNDPRLITLIIIDHVGLIDGNAEDKGSKKAGIDRLSRMLVVFRNELQYSPVVVSQFNRGIDGMDRKKFDSQEPMLSDFKDSGSTQEDADTAIALFNPHKYGLEKHRGYDVSKIKRRYRSLHILKNRDGMDNLALGLKFLGEVGKFTELPAADEMASNPKHYQEIINLNKQ